MKAPKVLPVVKSVDYFEPNRSVRMAELYRYTLYEESQGAIDTDDLQAVIEFLKANYNDEYKIGWILSRAGLRTWKDLQVSKAFSEQDLKYFQACLDTVQKPFLD